MDWIGQGWDDTQQKYFLDFKNRPEQVGLLGVEAAVAAVKEIAKTYPAPYTLMLSGGADSQALAYVWKLAGVEFDTLSVRYTGYNEEFFNEHDLMCMTEWARLHRIPINYKDFNVPEFLESEYDSYTHTYTCASPQICTYIKMSEFVKEGTVIFSGNPVFKYILNVPTPWASGITYSLLGLDRYRKISNRSIVPFFFVHTPELVSSFIETAEKYITFHRYFTDKWCYYMLNGIPVKPYIQKYSGFEGLKDYYEQYKNTIDVKTKLKYNGRPSPWYFDLKFRYPILDKLAYPDELHHIW